MHKHRNCIVYCDIFVRVADKQVYKVLFIELVPLAVLGSSSQLSRLYGMSNMAQSNSVCLFFGLFFYCRTKMKTGLTIQTHTSDVMICRSVAGMLCSAVQLANNNPSHLLQPQIILLEKDMSTLIQRHEPEYSHKKQRYYHTVWNCILLLPVKDWALWEHCKSCSNVYLKGGHSQCLGCLKL